LATDQHTRHDPGRDAGLDVGLRAGWPAGGCLSYADVDDALFDTTQIPLTTRDIRSVGELLNDVDQTARHLLMDITGDDAARVLNAWPALVAAANDLWDSLPGQHDIASHPERDQPITRLDSAAAAMGRSLPTATWPPATRPDRRLSQMTRTIGQAADLVHRYGSDIPLHNVTTQRDLQATRARIMHSLYLTAHAVGVALQQHTKDRYGDARNSEQPHGLNAEHYPRAKPPTTEWIRRMAVAETTASRYLDGRFTQALAGEAVQPLGDEARLGRALAGWDIQAHRTLATDDWATNMLLITRTQGLIAGAAGVLLDAAQLAGHLDPSSRLAPAIARAGQSWSNLASRWGDLTQPDARYDPNLLRAAGEVRAALRELTHNPTGLDPAHAIATRPGLARGTRDVLTALETSSELAYVVAEKANTTGLRGPARALSIRAHNDIEAGLARSPTEGDVVWISPADILAKRTVTVPTPVHEALRGASATLVDACSRAAAVSTPFALAEPSSFPDAGSQPPGHESSLACRAPHHNVPTPSHARITSEDHRRAGPAFGGR
jgi:hypothetical protein